MGWLLTSYCSEIYAFVYMCRAVPLAVVKWKRPRGSLWVGGGVCSTGLQRTDLRLNRMSLTSTSSISRMTTAFWVRPLHFSESHPATPRRPAHAGHARAALFTRPLGGRRRAPAARATCRLHDSPAVASAAHALHVEGLHSNVPSLETKAKLPRICVASVRASEPPRFPECSSRNM